MPQHVLGQREHGGWNRTGINLFKTWRTNVLNARRRANFAADEQAVLDLVRNTHQIIGATPTAERERTSNRRPRAPPLPEVDGASDDKEVGHFA